MGGVWNRIIYKVPSSQTIPQCQRPERTRLKNTALHPQLALCFSSLLFLCSAFNSGRSRTGFLPHDKLCCAGCYWSLQNNTPCSLQTDSPPSCAQQSRLSSHTHQSFAKEKRKTSKSANKNKAWQRKVTYSFSAMEINPLGKGTLEQRSKFWHEKFTALSHFPFGIRFSTLFGLFHQTNCSPIYETGTKLTNFYLTEIASRKICFHILVYETEQPDLHFLHRSRL